MIRSLKTLALALTAVGLLFSVTRASAQDLTSHATIKNIVLVHGAFADGSSWAKVITLLQSDGYNVVAVQNPLSCLADDVAATKRAIAQQSGRVVLVGHSWAGMAKRIHAKTTTLPAGDVPMLSMPQSVANVIVDAANSAKSP
jgi:pimeloyl-ACP methyl ester carboxylesterase